MHEAKFAVPKISLTISCCVLLYFVISQEASSQNSTNRSKKSIVKIYTIQTSGHVQWQFKKPEIYADEREGNVENNPHIRNCYKCYKKLLGLGLR